MSDERWLITLGAVIGVVLIVGAALCGSVVAGALA